MSTESPAADLTVQPTEQSNEQPKSLSVEVPATPSHNQAIKQRQIPPQSIEQMIAGLSMYSTQPNQSNDQLEVLQSHINELLETQKTLSNEILAYHKVFKQDCENTAKSLAPVYNQLAQKLVTLNTLSNRINAIQKKMTKLRSRAGELHLKCMPALSAAAVAQPVAASTN